VKNVQVIDGAVNSVFEIYEVDDETFSVLFPVGNDIVFASDIDSDFTKEATIRFWQKFYSCKKDKKALNGIHGTLHLEGSICKQEYYMERKEAYVIKSLII
jgi:hypothetical protein